MDNKTNASDLKQQSHQQPGSSETAQAQARHLWNEINAVLGPHVIGQPIYVGLLNETGWHDIDIGTFVPEVAVQTALVDGRGFAGDMKSL